MFLFKRYLGLDIVLDVSAILLAPFAEEERHDGKTTLDVWRWPNHAPRRMCGKSPVLVSVIGPNRKMSWLCIKEFNWQPLMDIWSQRFWAKNSKNVENCVLHFKKLTSHLQVTTCFSHFSHILRKDHWGRTAYHYGCNDEDILQVFERCLGSWQRLLTTDGLVIWIWKCWENNGKTPKIPYLMIMFNMFPE